MSIDYYECDNCSVGFRGDSDFCVWCECGRKFCNMKCGKLANYAVMEEPEEDEGEEKYQLYLDGNCRINLNEPITCIICRSEKYTDTSLLDAVLKHFKINKKQAIAIWKYNK